MIAGLRRFSLFLFAACLGLHAQTPTGMPSGTPAPAAPDNSTVPNDPAAPMLKQAYDLVNKKDLNGALTIVDEAVKNNPKSFASLTLRGMIYSQKKQWTSSEADFNSALAIHPDNIVVKFELAQIEFEQKNYAAAGARFQALTTDPVMGDFASYNVFLCNLLSGHEDLAKKELSGWDEETGPSYFYGKAAWALFHKNPEDARSYLASAITIFPVSKNRFYAASLIDLGYLPLPAPPGATP
jgi:tetratricopeptide (TPR) repeat protein